MLHDINNGELAPPVDPMWVEQLCHFTTGELNQALHNRIVAGHANHIKPLIDQGAWLTFQSIVFAVSEGRAESVKVLLECDVDFKKMEMSLLQRSIDDKNYDITLLLLEHGADPDSFNSSQIYVAQFPSSNLNAAEMALSGFAKEGDLDNIKKMMSAKMISPDFDMSIPANCAALHGHIDVLEHFFKNKVDPKEIKTFTGETLSYVVDLIRAEDKERERFTQDESFFIDQTVEELREYKEEYTESAIVLSAHTGRFVELMQHMNKKYQDKNLSLQDFISEDKYGFSVLEILNKEKTLSNVFSINFWKNDLKNLKSISKHMKKEQWQQAKMSNLFNAVCLLNVRKKAPVIAKIRRRPPPKI